MSYYISTGEKNGFYTLRRIQHEYTNDGMVIIHDNFIKNLSTDWYKALQNAIDTRGCDLFSQTPFELTEFGKRSAVWEYTLTHMNPYTLPNGKYTSIDFRTLDDNHLEYLIWYQEYLCSKDVSKTHNYIFSIVRVALSLFLDEDLTKERLNSIRNKKQQDANDEAAEKQRLKELSKHIGNKGDRLTFEGEIEAVTSGEGKYGIWSRTRIRTTDGNVVIWWNTFGNDGRKGMKVKFKATVKDHDEYEGEKHTIVLRATLL